MVKNEPLFVLMRSLNWLILYLQSTSKSMFISIILHEVWSAVTMMFDATTLDSKHCLHSVLGRSPLRMWTVPL